MAETHILIILCRVSCIPAGIIVYVSDKWDTYRRNDLEDENTETVWLEVRFPKARSILVCYVYRPPNSLISWFNNFSKQLELASKNRYETILLGDFNVDLTSHSYSNERNVLQDIIQLNSYTQIIDEYTRVTASSMSLIDHNLYM